MKEVQHHRMEARIKETKKVTTCRKDKGIRMMKGIQLVKTHRT
jgi:hypothetical protein